MNNSPEEESQEDGREQSSERPGNDAGGKLGEGPARKRSFWEEARVPIIATIIGSLVIAVATPLRNWGLGAADFAKDAVVAVVDYDAHQVDNLKERIDHRPGWTTGPDFLDESVDYLNDNLDITAPNLTEINEHLDPTVVSVDDLVERGVEFDGVPVVLVGRVLSSTVLNSDSSGDTPTREVIVSGQDLRHIVTLGTGGRVFNNVRGDPGEIVVVQGVLTATGRIDDPYSDEELESGYFTVLMAPEVSTSHPLVRRVAHALANVGQEQAGR